MSYPQRTCQDPCRGVCSCVFISGFYWHRSFRSSCESSTHFELMFWVVSESCSVLLFCMWFGNIIYNFATRNRVFMNTHTHTHTHTCFCFWWLSGKESTCQAGDVGLTPGSGRSTGERNGYSLQYFCLGNPMDRGAWQAAVCGVAELDMTEPLFLFSK